jgi:hypothetical protein
MRRALYILGVILIGPGSASAGAAVSTHGGGSVLEASYRLDIEVRGLFATVQSEQRLLSGGATAVEAVYTFELPGDAAVTGFDIALGAGKPQPGVITSEAGAVGASSSAIGDDLGALVQLAPGRPATADDPGANATYRYTASPVATDGATVRVRWIMPVQLDAGRVVLALPARNGADLAAAQGTIRFAPVAGLTAARDVRVGGAVIARTPGTKPIAWKLGPGDAIVIEAEVATRGDRPVFLADAVALGKDRGAIAAAIIAPGGEAATTTKSRRGERLLFVIDASRSMRRIDRAAVAAAIDAVARAAPATTELEAIGYDHTALRLLGTWRDNDAAGRTALATAVAKLGDANGTDLVAALAEATTALAPGIPTRVVVITDGGIDLADDADRMVAAFADRAGDVDVSSLVVVPPDRLAPGHGVAVLSELARRLGGRVRIARSDELADRAARLATGLGGGAAWSTPAISGTTTLAFPAVIAAGDGATAIGWYHGKPAKLALTIEHAGTSVKVTAGKSGTDAAALALARPDAVLELANQTAGPASAELTRAWAAAARKHSVVALASSALVVDTKTKLARDRRTQIARGAPYVSLPPAAERDQPLDGPDPAVLDALRGKSSVGPHTGGTLDPDSLKNILTIELLGRLRGCYQQALTRDTSLHGRIVFDLLMGDGEVIAATANGTTDTKFRACLEIAAHGILVPAVADPSLIRVRYPVEFTVAADKSFVVLGDADSAEPIDPSILPRSATPDQVDFDQVDDPLGGIDR